MYDTIEKIKIMIVRNNYSMLAKRCNAAITQSSFKLKTADDIVKVCPRFANSQTYQRHLENERSLKQKRDVLKKMNSRRNDNVFDHLKRLRNM